MTALDEIKQLLDLCSEEQRRELFELLRTEFPIHPIESKLNVRAEVILEAFDRASDLTLRGMRGIIAEAAFENYILKPLGWNCLPLNGDLPYDYLVDDGNGQLRIQVKLQRMKEHRVMMASEAYRRLPNDMYVVETQRTRGGRGKEGEATRPYRFGEFDILAVCMHPSTNNWDSFMYTVANWLLPRPENPALMLVFQPVAMKPNSEWTNDLRSSVEWLRSGVQKRILDLKL